MGKIGKTLRNLLYAGTFAAASILPGCEPDEPPEPPLKESIRQHVTLGSDNVSINYSADISNVDKAKLEVKREGVLILTEEIRDVSPYGEDYKKTYRYEDNPLIKKGEYEFILTSKDLEDKNNIGIQDYPATVNYTSIDLNENSEITVPLELGDINPEDNPVNAKSVKSLDGRIQVTLEGNNNLKIKATSNYYGHYQLELEFGSTEGGLEKKTLQGNVMKDMKMNPFVQPNDSTLNWYGSGDADGDNNKQLNENDLNRLTEVINGTYVNDNDKRLKDRCDVNGDEKVDIYDKKILEDKLKGVIPYLPGYWNELTFEEQKDWFEKMRKIDKTDEIPWSPQFSCAMFSYQTEINFNGIGKLTDISKILAFYPFDLSNNGRFNIPVQGLSLGAYDSSGRPIGGHAINSLFFKNSTLDYNSIKKFEPQDDSIDPIIGEGFYSQFGTNSKIGIIGLPVREASEGYIGTTIYLIYSVENNVPTLIYTNPNLIIPDGK